MVRFYTNLFATHRDEWKLAFFLRNVFGQYCGLDDARQTDIVFSSGIYKGTQILVDRHKLVKISVDFVNNNLTLTLCCNLGKSTPFESIS
jgi:hypothetical protein